MTPLFYSASSETASGWHLFLNGQPIHMNKPRAKSVSAKPIPAFPQLCLTINHCFLCLLPACVFNYTGECAVSIAVVCNDVAIMIF